MISQKLKNIFILSIILFVAHGVEEFFTGFYNVDKSFLLTVGKLSNNLPLVFIFYQIILWLILLLAYFFLRKNKWVFPIPITLIILMILELQHLYETLITGKYYPGTYTAVIFPLLAFLFWKELIKNLRQNHEKNY